MPRWVISILLVLAMIAILPFACIFKARGSLSAAPRLQLIQGMGNQPRYKGQMVNSLFADTRADRPWPSGTVARGRLNDDDALTKGYDGGRWVERFPVRVDATLLQRGQERYGIYCSPCHGLSGYGDGIVARRADALQEGTWVPPSSLHDVAVLARPIGHVFNTITNGIRTMPAYGAQIPEADRWAIVAYVRALQRSQHAALADLPADLRAKVH
jgi:mono/diheme cytochrome c family protein